MGILDRLLGRTAVPKPATDEQRELNLSNFPKQLLRGWNETPTAGVAVTTRSALSIPTVFAAVASVADTISTLPLPVYQDTDSGPVKLREHPVHRLLNVAPNRVQTAKAFRSAMVVDIMAEGEFFAEVQRDGSGTPVALYRIEPSAVQTKWVEDDGAYVLEYSVQGTVIPAENVLHVLGFSANGFRGDSPFGMCANSLSLTLAMDQFGASFIKNGARPGGTLTLPFDDPEKVTDAHKIWNETHGGPDKAGKTSVIIGGGKYDPTSHSPEESQFHESRIQQQREAQRVTRTPPYLSNDYERQTWSNIQYARMVFVEQSVKPICVAIEQAINKTLLGNAPDMWAEHVIEGLLRGSFSEQMEFITKGNGGRAIYTQNESRAFFNLPPLPGGDELNPPTPAVQPTPNPENNGNSLAV